MWRVAQMKGTSWVWAERPPCSPPAATTHGELGVSSRGRWPKAGPVRAGPPRHCTAQLPAPPQRAQGCFKSCLLNGERGRAPLTALLHPGGLLLWRHHSGEQLRAEGRPISTAFYPCQTHKQQRTKLVLGCSSVTGLLLLVMHEPQHPPFTVRLPADSPACSLKASSHLWTRSVTPGNRGMLIFKQSWSG